MKAFSLDALVSAEAERVSIPRRVLRGFRATVCGCEFEVVFDESGFNTPEGVEGFSRTTMKVIKKSKRDGKFQYPGGC